MDEQKEKDVGGENAGIYKHHPHQPRYFKGDIYNQVISYYDARRKRELNLSIAT